MQINTISHSISTVYPKKYAHGFCFAVLCCGYTLTDFPISIRLTSLALWQSNDCPSASKATLMNMDKYFMWIHYERLHNHNKAKHNKTVCIFLGIYCNPDSNVGWPNVGPTSVLSFRRWPNVSPTLHPCFHSYDTRNFSSIPFQSLMYWSLIFSIFVTTRCISPVCKIILFSSQHFDIAV